MTNWSHIRLIPLIGALCACAPDRATELGPEEPRPGNYNLVAINGVPLDNDGGTTARPLTLNNGLKVWAGSMDLRADHSVYEERWICFNHSGGGSCAARIYGDGAWTVVASGSLRFAFADSVRVSSFVGDTITVIWPTDTLRYQQQ